MTTLSDGRTDLPLGTSMEVVVGSKLQEICLFADGFFRDDVRERQNTFQPVQKTQQYLIVLIFFFQELNGQALPSPADTPVASTNLKGNVSNTEDSLCNWIQLQDVTVLLVSTWNNGPLRIQRHI